MSLASNLAERMAEGRLDKLPRVTRHATPEAAQALLFSYYGLRDRMEEIRAAESAGWNLQQRIAASSVAVQIDDAIAHTWAWLVRVARRGGRGVRIAGCRGGTPAVMAHGCAAVSSAVGPANVELQSREQASPADGSFFGLQRQELPVQESVGHDLANRSANL